MRRLINILLFAALFATPAASQGFFGLFDRQPSEERSEEDLQRLAEFVSIFGPPPSGPSTFEKRVAKTQYETAKKGFKGIVDPPGTFKDETAEVYLRWDMGAPVFYEGRYGVNVAFPDAMFEPRPLAIPVRAFSAVVVAPHLVVANAQRRGIERGACLSRVHPYLKRYEAANEANCKALPDVSE